MARLWPVLRVLLAVAILGAVLVRVDPGAALDEVRRAPVTAFAVPAVLLFFNTLLHGARLRLLLPDPLPSWGAVFRVVLLGNFFGVFLPTGGGEAAKVVVLGRRIGKLEEAAASLVTARVMELVPWALFLVWGALAVLPDRLPAFVPLAWGVAAGFAGVVLVAAGALWWGDAVLLRLPPAVHRRLHPVTRVRAAPRRLALCALLAFPFALVNVYVVAYILRAYGVALPAGDVLGVVPAVDVIIALPVTLSGIGVREGMFVHAFGAWGVAEPVALAVAFTRWSADLGRAMVGGVLFALAGDRRQDVTPPPSAGG
ncbi:MAG: lysylphosphatidylglycerol synthase transmembrane domain-containing protein [Myxococcota bacterium]